MQTKFTAETPEDGGIDDLFTPADQCIAYGSPTSPAPMGAIPAMGKCVDIIDPAISVDNSDLLHNRSSFNYHPSAVVESQTLNFGLEHLRVDNVNTMENQGLKS